MGTLDNVGWSGVHYAVLYNNQELLQELLTLFDSELLDIISNDGLSPIFLAL